MDVKKSIKSLIVMFFLSTLLIPAFILNKLFFIAVIGLMAIKLSPNNRVYTISPIIIFSVFAFGFIMSFFGNVDRNLCVQFILSVAVLFLIYPVQKYDINMDYVVKLSGLVLSLSTGFFFLAVVQFPNNSLSIALYQVFDKYSLGAYGLRDFTEEASLSFHLGTVPFLYLPFALFFVSYMKTGNKLNLLGMIVILPAIIASASRGLIMISLFIIVVVFFLNLKLPGRISFILVSIPVFILFLNYIILNTSIFSEDEVSNGTKIGHIVSFIDNINIVNFFIGDGLASFYFTKGSGTMKAHTEVTPLDMLRYFGFILTPIMYSALMFPVLRINAYINNKPFTLIFFLYLINSFTNPIMFNSYGLLIVLWYWSKVLSAPAKVEDKLNMRPE